MMHLSRRVLAAAAVAALLGAEIAAAGDAALVTPAEAIERAIADRVGAGMSVEVSAVDTTVAPERTLQALPDPAGRAGEPMRFVLMAGRVRRGVAVATVTILGAYARAARAIGRNETVTAEAIEIVRGELPSAPFRRLPVSDEVVGLTARRDIAPGEALTQTVLVVPPHVRSGDAVVLTVSVGSVRVTARAVAAASGYEGDTIRVLPEGGRAVKARITGRGAVEITQ